MTAAVPVALTDYPPGHPLRRAPLIEIGAQYRWHGGGPWRSVTAQWRIAGLCFDDLAPAWTACSTWRATTP